MRFGSLRVAVDRFQVRNPKALGFVQGILTGQESKELVRTLVKLIEAGRPIDPPLIWQDADGIPWIIDGHHRMEALEEAGTKPNAMLFVQQFKGTESEARAFALDVTKRTHLNMPSSEALDGYWLLFLCGETEGSVRARAKQYGVGVSTVSRMSVQKAPVLAQLQQEAKEQGVPADVSFIRSNAPAWKELAEWREGKEIQDKSKGDRRVIEAMLKTLATRFAKHAKAQPEVLMEAFKEFMEEATDRTLFVRFDQTEADENSEV